jgi:hypothetical protein
MELMVSIRLEWPESVNLLACEQKGQGLIHPAMKRNVLSAACGAPDQQLLTTESSLAVRQGWSMEVHIVVHVQFGVAG